MLIFTYGTLMKGFETCEEAEALTDQFRLVGRGTTSGVMYDFENYPGVVRIVDAAKAKRPIVHGVVYVVPGSLMPRVDAYEGAPNLYERVMVPVTLASGGRVLAWMYFFNIQNASRNGLGDLVDDLRRVVPSGDWRKVIRGRI